MSDQLTFIGMKRPFDILSDLVQDVPMKFDEIYCEREASDVVVKGEKAGVLVELWVPDQSMEEIDLEVWDLEEMGEMTCREWLNHPLYKDWWAKTIMVEIDGERVWLDSYKSEVNSYYKQTYEKILFKLQFR